jgi:hypothetical protein
MVDYLHITVMTPTTIMAIGTWAMVIIGALTWTACPADKPIHPRITCRLVLATIIMVVVTMAAATEATGVMATATEVAPPEITEATVATTKTNPVSCPVSDG